MRLLQLDARDWMAYALLHVDFRDVTALAITGDNNMGKSALQNAVTMALYGRVGREVDQRSADLLVRRGSSGFMVRVTFRTPDGREVEVTREKPLGRTMALGLVVDGVSQRGHIIGRANDEDASLDETQARIIDLIGLTYDQLVAGPFMVQQGSESKPSSFLMASPAARKDLLIRLLGLDEYEHLHDKAKALGDEYGAAASRAAARVAELQPVVDAGATLLADLEAAQGELKAREQSVRAWTAGVEEAQHARNAAVLADSKRLNAVHRLGRAQEGVARETERVRLNAERVAQEEARLAQPEPVYVTVPIDEPTREVLTETDERVKAAEANWAEQEQLKGHARALEEEVARAERARAILPTVPCGGEGRFAACQFLQDVPPAADVEGARASLERTRALLSGDDVYEAWMAAKADWSALYDALGAASRAKSANAAARAAYDSVHESAVRAVATARQSKTEADAALAHYVAEGAAAQAEVEAAGSAVDMTTVDDALAEAKAVLKAADEALTAQRATLRPLEAKAAVLEQAMADLALEVIREKKASRIATVYRDLQAAWSRDGVPTSLLEQAVPRIEAHANAILERFPQDLRVALRTQRPTKKGGMAEKLDVVVTIGGAESVPGLLSVGANFRIDVALRMALTSVTGARVETLWLDEPLAALDAAGREAVVQTLSDLGEDFGLVVAVSHHADFNDALPARLDIRQEAGVATATLL